MTFDEDSEKDIDTVEIEEEDWIEEKFGTNSRCDCCTVVSCHPPPWCPSPGLLVPPGFWAPCVLRVLSVVLIRI